MISKKENNEEVELEYEKEDSANGLDDAVKKVQKLKKELKECQAERQEYLDGWQRLRADVANKKKEADAQGKKMRETAQKELLQDILPILDSFDMAFSGDAWERVDEGWRKGVENIFAQLENIFSQHNIVSFGEAGDDFDPHRHEAVEIVETSKSEEDGVIAEVLRRGYLCGENVLRPAQVKIFKNEN